MFTFLSTEPEIELCAWRSNEQGPTDYSEFELSPLSSLSTRAGTPLGHTFPCLWMGTYFFNFFPILQPASLHRHQPCVARHGPQAVGCEVHISLFGQPDLSHPV